MSATLKPSKILFFDTETTGIDPVACDIWQIAGIVEINGKVEEEFDIRLAPRADAVIEAEALKLQNLTKEELFQFPSASQGKKQLERILSKYVRKYDKTDKFVPCGFNVRFDLDHTRQLWAKQNDKYFGSFFFTCPIDVATLVGEMVARYSARFPNHKLSTICDALNIPIDAHDALSDIRATRMLYLGLRKMFGNVGIA